MNGLVLKRNREELERVLLRDCNILFNSVNYRLLNVLLLYAKYASNFLCAVCFNVTYLTGCSRSEIGKRDALFVEGHEMRAKC